MKAYKGWKEIRTALLAIFIAAAMPMDASAEDTVFGPESDTGYWQTDRDGGWRYYLADGSYASDTWQWLSYNEIFNWYHFDGQGYLTTGWLYDGSGCWYYLNPVSDESKGGMQTGWLIDDQDGNCYYFDPEHGAMVTGWQDIEGYQYYFNESGSEQSGWIWDSTSGYWIYYEMNQVPLGY